MPDGGNGDWLPKGVLIGLWFYTGGIVLTLLYLVLFNPGNVLGESQAIILGADREVPGASPPPCSSWGLS